MREREREGEKEGGENNNRTNEWASKHKCAVMRVLLLRWELAQRQMSAWVPLSLVTELSLLLACVNHIWAHTTSSH